MRIPRPPMLNCWSISNVIAGRRIAGWRQGIRRIASSLRNANWEGCPFVKWCFVVTQEERPAALEFTGKRGAYTFRVPHLQAKPPAPHSGSRKLISRGGELLPPQAR